MTAPAAPARASQAAGWRTVSFDAVSLQVPSAWPAWNLVLHPAVCPLLDTHAVYLGRPGPDPACPGAAFGKTDAVQLQPIDPQSPDVAGAQLPTVLGGRPAMTNADAAVTHTIVDLLPTAGVEVSLSYGSDPALVRHIESTITVGSTDSGGRPPEPPATAPGRFRGSAQRRARPRARPRARRRPGSACSPGAGSTPAPLPRRGR